MNGRFVVGLLVLTGVVCAQRRLDPRNTYQRIVCVVPMVGKGLPADPKQPQAAPWPPSQDPKGIVAFFFEPSDDGKLAVVEFVAQNRSAFQAILNDKTIQIFEKGRASKASI